MGTTLPVNCRWTAGLRRTEPLPPGLERAVEDAARQAMATLTARRRPHRPAAAQPHRRPLGARLRRPDHGPAIGIDHGLAVGRDGRQLPGRAAGRARPTLAVLRWRLQPAAAA